MRLSDSARRTSPHNKISRQVKVKHTGKLFIKHLPRKLQTMQECNAQNTRAARACSVSIGFYSEAGARSPKDARECGAMRLQRVQVCMCRLPCSTILKVADALSPMLQDL